MVQANNDQPFWQQVYELLQELCSSNDLRQRESVTRQLMELDREPTIDALSTLLSDDNPELQGYAAQVLVEMDPKNGVKLMTPLLESLEATLRWHICGLLGKYGDEQVTMPLVNVLRTDQDIDVRYAAVFALGKVGDLRAVPVLEWIQHHDDGMDYHSHRISTAATDAIQEVLGRHSGSGDITY
jgi:HEAT repeat protein